MTLPKEELITDINKLLILGSGSKAREQLLTSIGLVPSKVVTANIDEEQRPKEKPLDYVRRMALEKSNSINVDADDILVTADTIVLVGQKILHKTVDRNKARKNLESISGRRHKVMTSFCVKKGVEIKLKTVKTILKMKQLSDKELEDYLSFNEWKGKAGSYSIQGKAICFFPFISGCYSNIIGLPLPKLISVLRPMGFSI